MEHHVDRKTQMGARVLINDGWYKTTAQPLQRPRAGMSWTD